jgi:hypothetical protein
MGSLAAIRAAWTSRHCSRATAVSRCRWGRCIRARSRGRVGAVPAGRPGWPARWPPGARPSAAGVAISATSVVAEAIRRRVPRALLDLAPELPAADGPPRSSSIRAERDRLAAEIEVAKAQAQEAAQRASIATEHARAADARAVKAEERTNAAERRVAAAEAQGRRRAAARHSRRSTGGRRQPARDSGRDPSRCRPRSGPGRPRSRLERRGRSFVRCPALPSTPRVASMPAGAHLANPKGRSTNVSRPSGPVARRRRRR